ncbi:MAG: ABC transporter permease [Planctomycetota bacterium]
MTTHAEQNMIDAAVESATDVADSAPFAAGSSNRYEITIDQSRGGVLARLREAFDLRGLLWMLVQRDIKTRYRQAALGIAWGILVPAATLAIYWFVFGYLLGRLGTGDVPYVLFLFPAMLGWKYFNSAIGRASQSLKRDASILSKIYFPRLLLPVASIISPTIDVLLGGLVLVVILIATDHVPPWTTVFVPGFLLLGAVAAGGLGMGLAAFNAHYRDVQHFLPVVLHLGFFCTPVLYGSDRMPEAFRLLYAFNPMVTVCEGMRWAVLGHDTPLTLAMGLVSTAVAFVMLFGGLWAFMRFERNVVDVL